MQGISEVTIMGNVGQQPELRYTNSNVPVTEVSVAVNKSWKDKETGEKKEKTTWTPVVFFGKPAETIAEWVKQGNGIYIKAEVATKPRKVDGAQYGNELMLKGLSWQFVGGGKPEPTEKAKTAATPKNKSDDFDDDIPF